MFKTSASSLTDIISTIVEMILGTRHPFSSSRHSKFVCPSSIPRLGELRVINLFHSESVGVSGREDSASCAADALKGRDVSSLLSMP